MTLNDLLDNEPSIMAQDGDIGIPSYEELRQSPNTRWIDPYTNSQGQKDGGFFGSINDNYYNSFVEQREPFILEENPQKSHPIKVLSMSEGEPEVEQEEESPIVLEGGVEENVYLPEEDESEPSVYIPDEEEPEERQKTPYELSDEDLTDILQSIIKAKTIENTQSEPIFDDSFPTLPQTDTPNTLPVSLPQIQTSLNQEELKQMYEKLLEELRKMLAKYKRLSNMAKFQKVASKAPIYNEIENEYYRNSLKMKDGEPLTPKFIEENDVYNYQDITDPEKSNYYKKQLAKMYGLDVNAPDINEKLKDKKIVVPKKTSRLYQYAMNSDAFQKWVSENYDKIKNGESYNNKIEFPLKMNKRDIGMYATIHRANLNNMKINPDGSITGNLVDPYNFEKWKYNNILNVDNMKQAVNNIGKNIITGINNTAYNQQTKNQLNPYYIDMPIKITNEDYIRIKSKNNQK